MGHAKSFQLSSPSRSQIAGGERTGPARQTGGYFHGGRRMSPADEGVSHERFLDKAKDMAEDVKDKIEDNIPDSVKEKLNIADEIPVEDEVEP